MPVHDWIKVRDGMFHDFHVEWLTSIKHALNHGILPKGYYATVDQHTGKFLPDVLTLESVRGRSNIGSRRANAPVLLTKPRRRPTAEAEIDYRGRKKVVAVHHVSNDDVVAIVEIVSPGNKKGKRAFSAFVNKISGLLMQQVHVLVVDVLPTVRRTPEGIHAAIWEDIAGENYRMPKRRPLTAVSYEADTLVRAYVEHFAVGDRLPDMPLFLEPEGCVDIPLEKTYMAAFAEVPEEWQELVV